MILEGIKRARTLLISLSLYAIDLTYMQNTLRLLVTQFFLLAFSICYSQNLEVEGTIKLSESNEPPTPGTIRWSGSDFEGWNGLTWMSLTGNSTVGSMMDRDGNTYKTIRIGHQEWMAENLRVRQFNDGRGISGIISNSGWISATFSARCSYNNNESLANTYGYLYNWYARKDGKLCPVGWHIPSNTEFLKLEENLGGYTSAGSKMKHAGPLYWIGSNSAATNESGWTALPGGFRSHQTGEFQSLGFQGRWFSTGDDFARSLNYNSEELSIFGVSTIGGYSVRCIKD